jgi:hypothetical protein
MATFKAGAGTYPLAAGAANSAQSDPVLLVLLDFLGYCLKQALDTKFAATPLPSGATDACPTANRYPFDPATYWVRQSVPALYCWWDGPPKVEPLTMTTRIRKREIAICYVFEELVYPDGADMHAGLMSDVDMVFAQALAEGYHPTYAYGNSSAGIQIAAMLAPVGMLGFEYLGGTEVLAMPVPEGSMNAQAGGDHEGQVVRAFPSLRAKCLVHERIGRYLPSDPGDVLTDSTFTINTNENTVADPSDVAQFTQRVLPSSDGTEDGG